MIPYYDQDGITIYHGDCREVLPMLGPVDLVLTDPPYGVGKADWDALAPLEWLPQAAALTPVLAVMPGIVNIAHYPFTVGDLFYRWMLSVHLTNGMTRGLMGFGNWIPVMVYSRPDVSLYAPQQDAAAVTVSGAMPGHPSPKPLGAMRWILSRFPEGSVLDPFMGSGTTLRAAKDLGRKAIGIELDERYCEIAATRLQQQVFDLAVPV